MAATGPAEESKGTQYYDCCAAQLLPPLILARMAELAARNALRQEYLGGGRKPDRRRELQVQGREDSDTAILFTISNHIPNRYVLSFHPLNPHPGFHAIALKLPDAYRPAGGGS